MSSAAHILLIQAQYINLLDRMVRNHETRQDPSLAREPAWQDFKFAARETAQTLDEYYLDESLPSEHHRRQHQAHELATKIRSAVASYRPYDGHTPALVCNEVGQFLSAENQRLAA